MGRIYNVRRTNLSEAVSVAATGYGPVIDIDTETHIDKTAFSPDEIRPNPQLMTNRRFREPATVLSDFKNNLLEDKPFVNYTYELVYDWYARFEKGYEPIYVRAQQTPIDWKSKIGNSDMSTNFKTTHETKIHKGDLVIREDGGIYLLNWNVTDHANNQATQSTLCNEFITVKRMRRETTDEEGFLTEGDPLENDLPFGIGEYNVGDNTPMETIVDNMPCSYTEYAGRPDFSTAAGQPGILGDDLISVYFQYNRQTKNIRVGDQFIIGPYTYRTINMTEAEVNIEKTHGIIMLNARRIAGGGQVG